MVFPMNSPLPDQALVAIKDLLFRREKIAAIKLYRESTGCDLREAKTEVDAIEAALLVLAPEKFAPPRKVNKGCLIAILAIDLLIVLGVLFYFMIRR